MMNGEAADDRPGRVERKNGNLKGGAGRGVLTKAGLLQGVELGSVLRERYMTSNGGLVKSADDVLLRCSLTTRTVETLQGVLQGAFPNDRSRTFDVLVGKRGNGSAHTDFLNFNTPCCSRLDQLYGQAVAEWSDDRKPHYVRDLVHKLEKQIEGTALTKSGHAQKYG